MNDIANVKLHLRTRSGNVKYEIEFALHPNPILHRRTKTYNISVCSLQAVPWIIYLRAFLWKEVTVLYSNSKHSIDIVSCVSTGEIKMYWFSSRAVTHLNEIVWKMLVE